LRSIFDGTVVTHEYPDIGKDIGAVPVLKRLVAAGHLLILNTMRSGPELEAAVGWFEKNDIPLHGVNEDPGQKEWTQSPKVYANLYIDDAAFGCPLVYPVSPYPHDKIEGRPFVDWVEVERIFFDHAYCYSPCPDPVIKGDTHEQE
jgi:hypothetical protein